MDSQTSRGALEELRTARAELVSAVRDALEPELVRLADFLERSLHRFACWRATHRVPADWWIYAIGAIASVLLGYAVATAIP